MSEGFEFISNDLRANGTPVKPGRSLDTPFQVSLTRPALVTYSVYLNTGSVAPSANAEAKVGLYSDASNPPTTRRCEAEVKVTRSSLTTGTHASESTITLTAFIPAGHWVELQSAVTGTASAVLTEEDEVVL